MASVPSHPNREVDGASPGPKSKTFLASLMNRTLSRKPSSGSAPSVTSVLSLLFFIWFLRRRLGLHGEILVTHDIDTGGHLTHGPDKGVVRRSGKRLLRSPHNELLEVRDEPL